MDDDNVHKLWHQRIDEKKIQNLAKEFILAVRKCGFAITNIEVSWDGKFFKTNIHGHLLKPKKEN